jgi:uncharacterized protein
MTARSADALIVRPQPSQDDAVPNANGVFVEALVRLAALTGTDEDRRAADEALERLMPAAAGAPVGHTSILNALDLHLRGISVVIVNDANGALRKAALRVPYLERTVCALDDPQNLADAHPAKELARAAQGPRAVVCAGMRCSLPISTADDLMAQVREMLAPPRRP